MIALLLGLALGQTAALPEVEAASTTQVASPQYTAVVAGLVVQVGKPVEASDALVEATEALGGWFQARTDTHLELRVPTAQVDTLLEHAAALGKVAERSAERIDLTRDLAEAQGRLASRQEVLERYYEVLDSADPASIVGVERQIVSAIEQIEQLQGRVRVLSDRAAHARVVVDFRFRDRTAPRRDGSSSFPWLNTLNVSDVLYGLQTRDADWTTRGATGVAPDGFSAWRKKGRFRAASPNGVLFRVRTERHKPEADAAFWREAVRERMIAAGYKVAAEEESSQGGYLELVSPLGPEDWTYAIRFAVNGKRLVIAEAAGEVTRFDGHREVVRAALDASMPD